MKTIKIAAYAFAGLGFAVTANAQVTVSKAAGHLESAYAEWAPVSGASSYNVYADGQKIDNQLIRSYGSYMRADVVGLKAGEHTLKIAPVVNGAEGAAITKTVTVLAHDRAGFAFSNGRVPGAYNVDGTLKNGAIVLYVSENTKNTLTMDVVTSSKGATTSCKSFQGILNCMKKGYENRPIAMRFVGNVTDSDSLVAGDMLIDLGSSENSYLTIEGVGEDATANGWGIRIKNAQNVEVRNMGIMNVNSNEGDNIGLQQNDQYVWVHNNDFFYGDAGSDADQVKGDGALDCKKSTYVTFSYNHFFDNGKSNLLGLSEGTTEGLYITYHHNWYDHSDSRHPRVRYYSAHVYNNYYDGNAKYGIGSTLGSSIFAEGNYFRNCKYPMLTSMQGSDVYGTSTKRDPANLGTFSKEAGGSIKAFNNYIEGGTFIPYGATKYTLKGVETSIGAIDSKKDFDAYVVTSRTQEMPFTVTSFEGANKHNNFDLSNVMYKYSAEEPLAAKSTVIKYAGRVNGGDFKWNFTAEDDEKYEVNQPLKNALVAYRGNLKAIQGEGNLPVIPPSSSSVKPESSSSLSSSSVSSSSVKPSSSSSVNPSSSSSIDSEILPIENDIVLNFTEDASSDYFGIIGSLSTSKGEVNYNGETLSRCLKLESSTTVDFTLLKSAKVTLVLNSDFAKNVIIDGEKVAANAGVVTINLAAGAHQITKGDVANIYMIIVKMDSDGATTSIQNKVEYQMPMRFDPTTNRLEIYADYRSINLMNMLGKKINVKNSNAKTIDLNYLQPGIYIIRLEVNGKMFDQRIVKR